MMATQMTMMNNNMNNMPPMLMTTNANSQRNTNNVNHIMPPTNHSTHAMMPTTPTQPQPQPQPQPNASKVPIVMMQPPHQAAPPAMMPMAPQMQQQQQQQMPPAAMPNTHVVPPMSMPPMMPMTNNTKPNLSAITNFPPTVTSSMKAGCCNSIINTNPPSISGPYLPNTSTFNNTAAPASINNTTQLSFSGAMPTMPTTVASSAGSPLRSTMMQPPSSSSMIPMVQPTPQLQSANHIPQTQVQVPAAATPFVAMKAAAACTPTICQQQQPYPLTDSASFPSGGSSHPSSSTPDAVPSPAPGLVQQLNPNGQPSIPIVSMGNADVKTLNMAVNSRMKKKGCKNAPVCAPTATPLPTFPSTCTQIKPAHGGAKNENKKKKEKDPNAEPVDFNQMCRHFLVGKCNRFSCHFRHA